jgi:hypothetical protein
LSIDRILTAFIVSTSILVVGAHAESQLTRLPDVSSFRPDQDLSNYRTYAWNKNQTVPTENMANHLRFINAVQAEMKERGFRLDTVNPEVRIQYRLDLRERVQGTSSQERSVWDNANSIVKIDFSRQTNAHLSVQFVEAESNFLLWNAQGQYPVGTPDRAEMQINAAVADVFKQYPAKE